MTIEEFIRDLESLHSEVMSCKSFREKYLEPNDKDWSNIPDLVGNLSHYIDDEDWRAKDEEYKSMQKGELLKLIRLLKSGAGDKDLQKITFLGKSD